jgi:hypothetical protein
LLQSTSRQPIDDDDDVDAENEKNLFFAFSLVLEDPEGGCKISAKNFCMVEIVPEDFTSLD